MKTGVVRLTLLGVGAMNSPRYAPAGLLVEVGKHRIMLDGGPGAKPAGKVDAWLVTDEQGELMRAIRRLARAKGLNPHVSSYSSDKITIAPHRVIHTTHVTYGYLIKSGLRTIVWAPEFFKFPRWAGSADMMFAEASSWNRPIRFRGGVGGHAPVLEVAREAKRRGVQRLVFAHIGRPTIRAIDAGLHPPFGEFGQDGDIFLFGPWPGMRRE